MRAWALRSIVRAPIRSTLRVCASWSSRVSDLRRLAGSVIVTGVPAAGVDVETCDALRALGPAGIVLFDRNVSTLEATCALVDRVRDAIGGDAPALVCVDQEGGRVARLGFREFGIPAMMALGASDDVELAERCGAALAADVRRIGANVDFAPVLDLALEPHSTVIGTRSLGDDPERVGRLGSALVRGLQRGGVAAVAKHFPGHGATARDSHRDLPTIDASPDLLRARELRPFARAIEAGVRAVMTAHLVVTELDDARPATLSARILTQLLREELRFDGVCFTDCLQMAAIADGIGTVAGGAAALAAGADALLVSHDRAVALALRDEIVRAVTAGEIPFARLEEAAWRSHSLRATLARESDASSRSISSDDDDASLAIARAAIALVRGNPVLDPERPVTVVSFEGDASDGVASGRSERPSLSAALRRRRYRSEVMRVPYEPDADALGLLVDVLRAQGDRALVIVARRAHLYERQRSAIEALVGLARHAVVVSALEPFDVPVLESASTLLCTFGDGEASIDALADVLCGERHASGSFPVSIASDPSRRMLTEAEIDARLPSRGRARSLDAPGDDAEAGGA
jgi:beta-N-acetylhexosaminidase